MTRQQIDILIKDQDIWLESSPEYTHSPKASFKDYDDGEIYVVSDELYSIIEKVFQHELNFESDLEHEVFKKIIANRIELISPLKEDRTLFYKELLKDQNDQLSEILSGNYYSSLPELISKTFDLLFYENGMKWIECLKFEVLKGKNLYEINFGSQGAPRTPNLNSLYSKIRSDSMYGAYQIVTIEKNIKYLQNILPVIEDTGEPELEQIDIAILCILKNEYLYELSACREKMTAYNKKLSHKKAPELRNKYNKLKLPGNLIKTKYPHQATAMKVISSLKKIMSYLSDSEKVIATNTINSIEAII